MATSALKLRAAKHSLLYKRAPEQHNKYIFSDCLQVTPKTILRPTSTNFRKIPQSTDSSDHIKDSDCHGDTSSHASPHKHKQWNKQKRVLKQTAKRMINSSPSSEPMTQTDDWCCTHNHFSCPVIDVRIKKKPVASEQRPQSLTPRQVQKNTRTPVTPRDKKDSDVFSIQEDGNSNSIKNHCLKPSGLISEFVQAKRTLVRSKTKERDPLVASVTKRNKIVDDVKPKIPKEINATSNVMPESTISKIHMKSSVWKQDESFDKIDNLWEPPPLQGKMHKEIKEPKRSKTSTGYYQDRKEYLPVRAAKSARPQRCPTASLEPDKPALTHSACRTKCLQLEEYLYNDNLPKFQETLLLFSPEDRKTLADFKETKLTANIFFRACGLAKVPFVKFLLEHCSPDLETRGPFFLLDDHTQYMVTPLWQAAASGCLHLVRILKENGADINANSDTGSSPLLVACYMTRIDVATFLVSNKAAINSCNAKGLTCLMNAVHCVDLVRLLVLNGAEINRADNRGNTSVHFAVEEGRVKTVKILIEQGGNPLVINKDGFNALQFAAKYRHRDVLEYLLQVSRLKVADIIDLYEMIGAMVIIMDDDLDEGFVYLHKATTLRYLNKSQVIMKKSSPSLLTDHENETEFVNVQQLNKIASNPKRLRIQALMIYERQWGSSHNNFLQLLLYCGATFADHLNFKEAANLWRLSYQLHFEKHLDDSTVCDPFNHNVLKSLGFLIKLLFQWRKVLVSRRLVDRNDDSAKRYEGSNSFDNCYFISESNVRRVLCLLLQHCIAAHKWLNAQTTGLFNKYKEAFYFLLRSAICVLLVYVESFSRHERCDNVWPFVQNLISINPRGEQNETLLHMCICPKTLNKLDLDITGSEIKWPSITVINIALILGANPTDSNKDGNTPLHFAAVLQRQGILSEEDGIIQSLLSKGGHADQVNNFGETAYNLLGRRDLNRYSNTWQKGISLKCLSARVIAAYGIEYIGEIPTSLYSFIELHRSIHIQHKTPNSSVTCN